MRKKYKIMLLAVMLLSVASAAYAAPSVIDVLTGGGTDVSGTISKGTGLNKDFDSAFSGIALGIMAVAKPIVIILTALSGAMIIFGWDGISKTLWTTIFGLTLALNIGYVILDPSFFGVAAPSAGTNNVGSAVDDLASRMAIGKSASENSNFLGGFMIGYMVLIERASLVILPYLDKLLLILLFIDVTLDAAMNLNDGNKFKYLIDICLKGGFYLFLLHNWISANAFDSSLTHALSAGFESLGYMMGGNGYTDLRPDDIVGNAAKILTSFFSAISVNFGLNFNTLLLLPALVVILGCLLFTAMEIFMARIEFYTMSLLTMPLLPFGVCKYTKFLSEKTFGVMFNIAIKLMAMAFLQSFTLPYLMALTENIHQFEGSILDLPTLTLEFVLACLVIWYLTKNISSIINTLLTGSPNLSGGGMAASAMGAAAAAGKFAGGIAGAGAAAGGFDAIAGAAVQGAQGAGGNMSSLGGIAKGAAGMAAGAATGGAGLVMSTLGNVAKAGANAAIGSNPIGRGFQSGVTSMIGEKGSGGLLRGPAIGSISNALKDAGNIIDADGKTVVNNKAANAAKIASLGGNMVGKIRDAASGTNALQGASPAETIPDSKQSMSDMADYSKAGSQPVGTAGNMAYKAIDKGLSAGLAAAEAIKGIEQKYGKAMSEQGNQTQKISEINGEADKWN